LYTHVLENRGATTRTMRCYFIFNNLSIFLKDCNKHEQYFQHTRGVQKVLQIAIQKIHKALEFDFI